MKKRLNSFFIIAIALWLSACSDVLDLSNDAPKVRIIAPPTVGFNTEVTLDGSGTKDVDGEIETYEWSQDENDEPQVALTIEDNKAIAKFTSPEAGIGKTDLHFTLKATDKEGKIGSRTVVVTFNGSPAYNVSGKISVAAGNHMDSDINNPDASYVANDTIDTPQSINNPSRVVGYVNVIGSGSAGRSQAAGDRSDFYRVDMLGDQVLELQHFIENGARFELYLYDTQKNLVNVALAGNVDENEKATLFLRAPRTGEYLVQIYAATGAGNYKLSVVDAEAYTFLPGVLSLDHNFAINEAIVLKNNADIGLQAKGGDNNSKLIDNYLPETTLLAGGKGGASRYRFDQSNDKKRYQNKQQNGLQHSARQYAPLARASVSVEGGLSTLKNIIALRARADVKFAEPNYHRATHAVPNDPLYPQQSWHYEMINLPQTWDLTIGSDRVVVAVLDTGMLSNHPDLMTGTQSAGYDFVSDILNSADGDGIDDDPEDASGVFHGAHVAGTVSGSTNNGIGIAGVAWSTSLMPVRVLGSFGGSSYDMLQGMLYAAGLANDSDTVPEKKADVINMSLGGGGFSSIEQLVVNRVRANDVLIVASAGNESVRQVAYPAAYDGVISVGALGLNKSLADYSNTGKALDIVAPGGDTRFDTDGDGFKDGVLSTAASFSGGIFNYTYDYFQGTSMAAPHVAGVIALMKSQYPEMTPADFDDWLSRGILTEDLGTYGQDNVFGNGLMDAYKAVQVAQVAGAGGTVDNPPRMMVSPEGLNFGYDRNELEFRTTALGRGSKLRIFSIYADRSWISVESKQSDAHKYGIYTVKIDRSKLVAGLYQGKVIINTEQGDFHLGIVANASKRIPFVFTTLHMFLYDFNLDPLLQSPLFSETATQIASDRGVYDYKLINVPLGKYLIFTGVDIDNDGEFNRSHFDPVGVPHYPDNPLIDWLDVVKDVEGFNFSIDIN